MADKAMTINRFRPFADITFLFKHNAGMSPPNDATTNEGEAAKNINPIPTQPSAEEKFAIHMTKNPPDQSKAKKEEAPDTNAKAPVGLGAGSISSSLIFSIPIRR